MPDAHVFSVLSAHLQQLEHQRDSLIAELNALKDANARIELLESRVRLLDREIEQLRARAAQYAVPDVPVRKLTPIHHAPAVADSLPPAPPAPVDPYGLLRPRATPAEVREERIRTGEPHDEVVARLGGPQVQ